MNKKLFLGLAAILAFSLAACGTNGDGAGDGSGGDGGNTPVTPGGGGSGGGGGGGAPANQHTVTLNEAPASGRTVYAHAWTEGSLENPATKYYAAASVSATTVTFELDLSACQGFLIAELKEGVTVMNEDSVWNETVERSTYNVWNVTEKTHTAKWKTPVPDLPYIAIAIGGEWEQMDYVQLVENTADTTEYMATGVSLGLNDIIYFGIGSSDWRHHAAIKTDSDAYSAFEEINEGDHNSKVVTAGSYDFYVKKSAGVNTIWVQEHSAA